MTDHLTPERRSWLMSRIGSRDTAPEMAVRRLAHALGYRFRLHRKNLPGTPDLVFPRFKVAVFVHGCFWHRHQGCRKATVPKSREEFWRTKFDRNVRRDCDVLDRLANLGWRTLVVWQCETIDIPALAKRLQRFLDGDENQITIR